MKKIVGIIIFMLLISTVLPALGITNKSINEERKSVSFLNKNNIATSQNGVILAQELDEDNKGYSIIRVSGSHYDMGYAQAELLGDYIVLGYYDVKDYAGNNYNEIREIMSEAVWLPQEIEDEFDGMVDCLANTHPSENIDKLDLKVANTFGDWAYGFSCRSHSCWGRYVSDPIKTISTRRLDFSTVFTTACHHVLCARDPDDGSPQWINLAWPGYVLASTSVNEYGVLVSSHDYNSQDTDFSNNCMPRMVAFRYASTYITNPDVSTHLIDIYDELQDYEIMTGGFLNYYAPEGFGGIITFNPFQSGSDIYDLRIPEESWHHGEAIITTNAWTDGTYTPEDEDFDADSYYEDELPKTHESHWNLLDKSGIGNRNLHMLSIAYRGRGDMTIWAEGKISSMKRTPRLEWEWNDFFNAIPPTTPDIDGEVNGKNGYEYEYSFLSTDANGDEIYYHVDWGDDSEEEIIGPISSGDIALAKHTWDEQGNYFIRVKAKDTTGLESEWGELEVSMPKNKAINHLTLIIERLIERFPILKLLLN
jgi:hypothetical protein